MYILTNKLEKQKRNRRNKKTQEAKKKQRNKRNKIYENENETKEYIQKIQIT